MLISYPSTCLSHIPQKSRHPPALPPPLPSLGGATTTPSWRSTLFDPRSWAYLRPLHRKGRNYSPRTRSRRHPLHAIRPAREPGAPPRFPQGILPPAGNASSEPPRRLIVMGQRRQIGARSCSMRLTHCPITPRHECGVVFPSRVCSLSFAVLARWRFHAFNGPAGEVITAVTLYQPPNPLDLTFDGRIGDRVSGMVGSSKDKHCRSGVSRCAANVLCTVHNELEPLLHIWT